MNDVEPIPDITDIKTISPVGVADCTGSIDRLSDDQIEGWATDRNNPEERLSLILKIDGIPIKIFVAKAYRPDIQAAGHGNGDYAFYEKVPKRFFDGGLHEIVVIFEKTQMLLHGSPLVTRFPRYCIEEIQGFVDNVTSREITGWALDPRNPSDPVPLELLIDGLPTSRTYASNSRDDLKAAKIGNGRCAFRFHMPLSALDNAHHTVSVRVVGTELTLIGPSDFTGKHHRPYKDFNEYLCWALYHHEIHPPFDDNDKFVIADMLRLSNIYEIRYSDTDQNDMISIIMPTYNRASSIRESINSILEQVYRNWELIIVDDASSDATEFIVASYQDRRIRYIRCTENNGPSVARSVGMKSASGSFFAYLDSDNTWDPRYLKILINSLKSHDAQSIYCAQVVHYVGKDAEAKRIIRYSPFNRSLLENTNYIDLNCYMHSRYLYDTYGGFREDIRMLEDWDLIERYTRDSVPIALPCLLSHYYVGKSASQVTFQENYSLTVAKIHSDRMARSLDINELHNIVNGETALGPLFLYNTGAKIRPADSKKFVSIIIPSYEAGSYLDACLASIMKYTPDGWFEIIVVDNASVGSALQVLDKYSGVPNLKVIQNRINVGFSQAVNQGINAAKANADVVLFNNDALVTEGWLEALWEVRDVVPDAALIVPRQTLLPGTETINTHVPNCNPQLEVDVNISAHHYNVLDPYFDQRRGFMQLSFAPFFCVYITRQCLESVGLLDEENGRHYRSDVVYCDLTRFITGGKMIYTPHSKIYHFLQKATNHLKETDESMYDLMFVQNAWENKDPLRGLL